MLWKISKYLWVIERKTDDVRSLKYENVFIKGYETMIEASEGIGEYLQFYNAERLHAAHNYRTPDQVHSLEFETAFITVGENALKNAA